MTYSLIRLSQSFCLIYAHAVINALFTLSICYILNIIETAFQNDNLYDIVINLGIAFIPLLIWQILFMVNSPRQSSQLLVFHNGKKNKLVYLGIFCITMTTLSIIRDLYLIYFNNLDIIPAGVIGQYLYFLVQPQLLTWSNLSVWLILRYLLIIMSICPYVVALTKSFNYKFLQWASCQDYWNHNYSQQPEQHQNTRQNKNNLFPRRRRQYRKKINYIE